MSLAWVDDRLPPAMQGPSLDRALAFHLPRSAVGFVEWPQAPTSNVEEVGPIATGTTSGKGEA